MSTEMFATLQPRAHGALSKLNAGRGTEFDVADLVCADPQRLTKIVEQWQEPGPVLRFRDLLAAAASFEDAQTYLNAEPVWTVVLFLTMYPNGEDVAMWFATRSQPQLARA